MKILPKLALIILWLFTFSLVFAAVWVRNPSLWVINLPEPAWDFLANSLDATCCERTADLELFVGVFLGLLLATVALISGVCIIKVMRKLTKRTA